MPRMKTSTMQARYRCGVVVEKHGEMVQCLKTKAAHHETISIKKKGPEAGKKVVRPPKVRDHFYGEPVAVPVLCNSCKEEIQPGDKYNKWSPYKRPDHIRHQQCGRPSRSFFTTSEIKGTAWDIADQEVPVFDSPDDASDFLRGVADSIDELHQIIEEKVYAIQEHFTDSPTIDELEERKNEIEYWQEAVSQAADEVASVSCSECENDFDSHDEETGHEFDMEEINDLVSEALEGCPE